MKGGGRIRTDDNGFAIRYHKNISHHNTTTCKTAKTQLTPQLTPKSQKQAKIDTSELPPDLAEIVAVWPELPEPVKAGVLAMVKAAAKCWWLLVSSGK